MIYGRSDLFITFTCNPSWDEIKNELFPRQKPQNRHDLLARVLHQKQKTMMNLIVKAKIFGSVQCHMYTIEWQKRGLSHAHILVWLKEKLHVQRVDEFISAEIPNPDEDPHLFKCITTQMVHGPCGLINPHSPCMTNEKCTKRYPRSFLRKTQTGQDGYPLYRRRQPEDGGFTANIIVRRYEVLMDNMWIVPYCSLLSKIFNAHINVEYCNSVKSIKYICKYVNKGSDMAVSDVRTSGNEMNEVHQYEMGRYISSNEAVWRILNFPIHECYPTVIHLSVHLENGQRVYFTSANEIERAQTVTVEIDKACVLIQGPKSFQELRTVEGRVCKTYKEACQVRGLLENDGHWNVTLEEASVTCSPRMLRNLFVVMLQTCAMSNPHQLWSYHKNSLSVDLLHESRLQQNNMNLTYNEEIYNRALIMIEDKIRFLGGQNLQSFGLPEPKRNVESKHIALAVASSGIAATLLTGGRTAHSSFKLPLNLENTETPAFNISRSSAKAKVLQECKLIVWDECTMSHKAAFEALDVTLQDLRHNNRRMGGITLVLAGDFRQTLPVVPRGTRADQMHACLKSSYIWNEIHRLYLRTNMRVQINGDTTAQEFAESRK
ncbi:hypothetical protein X975_25623, partial [Stegodyphus mimosarum]